MKNTVETLLRAMKANGYKWSFAIPNEEVIFVQKVLNLKGKSDNELFELWNRVDDELVEIIHSNEEGSELYELERDYGVTVLTIINGSKSFNQGILY